ncbi:MAG TPA: hypothetical protein VMY35_11380 [Phycisphaerae bacterium]|nr:hypothetical protein [Phycisphaerae bacterium]
MPQKQLPPIGGDVSSFLTPVGSDVSELMRSGSEEKTQGSRGVLGTLKDVGVGALKGAGKTATSVAELFSMANPAATGFAAQGNEFSRSRDALEPSNTAQQVGTTAEQMAEFLTPIGPSRMATKIAPVGKGLVKGLTRLATKGTGEAVEMGTKAALQTGGDPSAVKGAAVMGAVSPVVARVAKSAGNVLFKKFPEKLYSQVFNLEKEDWLAAQRSVARGQPLNPTTAREVMERGIWGTSSNMAQSAITSLDRTEQQLQKAIRGKFTIDVMKKPELVKMIDSVAEEFGGSFSKTGQEAAALSAAIRANDPQLVGSVMDAQQLLRAKRLLDGVRQTGSFKMSPKLSPKQEEFKGAADMARGVLRDAFPDAAQLLDEERILLMAIGDIAEDAVRRGNKKLIGFTDYILGGGGMATGYVGGGIGAAAAVRGFQQPPVLTGMGQALHRAGNVLPSAEPFTRGTMGMASSVSRPETPSARDRLLAMMTRPQGGTR